MLSMSDLVNRWGVTKLTLINWVRTGKIKPRKFKIGKRYYYGFTSEEAVRVERLIKPKKEWRNGQSILYENKMEKSKRFPK